MGLQTIRALLQIIEENNLLDKVKLALDVAASSFYEKGKYTFDEKTIPAMSF